MHSRWLNAARLCLELEPRGPVLIRSGIQTPDPTRPQLEFVRTRHARFGETIYLPGSSLKGVLRSHAERCLRGLGADVCMTFDGPCGRNQPGDKHQIAVFQRQCPICRTFGSLKLAGRFALGDAYPWRLDQTDQNEAREEIELANRTERRFQVGIDREKGSAQGSALFDLEVAVAGRFQAEMHLRNFELWQLGLLAAVVRDVDTGFAAVGSGKSRGFGQMAARILWLELECAAPPGSAPDPRQLPGIAALDRHDGSGWKLKPDEDRIALPEGVVLERTWRGFALPGRLAGAPLTALLASCDRPLGALVVRATGHGRAAGGA